MIHGFLPQSPFPLVRNSSGTMEIILWKHIHKMKFKDCSEKMDLMLFLDNEAGRK
jgi:hypothetical protein